VSYDGVSGWSTAFPTAKGPAQAKALAATPTGGSKAARGKKPKKAKPPCKYGPRGADGYCPSKPKAAGARGFLDPISGLPTGGAKKISSARSASSSSLSSRIALGASKEAAQEVVRRVVPRVSPRQTKKLAAAKGRAIVAEAKKIGTTIVTRGAAAGKTAGKALGAAATLSGGTIAAVAAAGAASYLATTAIINAIKNAKERKAQAAFQRAQAYRQSRLQAEAMKGAPLSAAEQAALSRAFKAQTGG